VLAQRPADLGMTTKSTPTDAVTVMDAAAERVILEGIRRHRPGDAVVAEESGSIGDSVDAAVTWHVDPLDGTVNYLYDLPAWSVSIAAVIGGETVAGVVFDVPHHLLYAASLDGPATCNGTPIGCRQPDALAVSLIATGFSYDADERRQQARLVAELIPQVRDIRRFGSAALDLCAVATGRVDGYFEEGGHSWDWLAGGLIARRAGAQTRQAPAGVAGRPLLAAAGSGIIDDLWSLVAPDRPLGR
jgi:myo-inositol-1(or 4)-monophosphatase